MNDFHKKKAERILEMADNHIPKLIMLDDTKPTQQQLREACEIALQIWQLQPKG